MYLITQFPTNNLLAQKIASTSSTDNLALPPALLDEISFYAPKLISKQL
jgi:hypothetical protein